MCEKNKSRNYFMNNNLQDLIEQSGKCILAQNSKFSWAGEAGGPSGSLKYILGTCSDMPKKTLGTALT